MSERKHTEFAMQAMDFAEMFGLFVGSTQLRGNGVVYTPELSTPEGESTGGGKQAVQHIKLVPTGGGSVVVIGSANTLDKTAKLRSFDHVSGVFTQRFKTDLPIARTDYDDLYQRLNDFFGQQNMQVSAEAAPAIASPSPAAGPIANAAASSSMTMMLIALVGAVIAGVVAYTLLS